MTTTQPKNMKILKPLVSAGNWSYVVNENGNAVRMTLEGYGSCTPIYAIQEMIDNLTPENFEKLWQECENKNDIKD